MSIHLYVSNVSVKVNRMVHTLFPLKSQMHHSRIIVFIGEDRHALNYLGSYKLKAKQKKTTVAMFVAIPDGKI